MITRRSIIKAALAFPALLLTSRFAFAATTHEVAIKGFAFDAADLSINVGDTVNFTNLDGAPHTATADNGSFDTKRLKKGASAAVTFSAAGEFTYFCKFHRKMKAVIRVS